MGTIIFITLIVIVAMFVYEKIQWDRSIKRMDEIIKAIDDKIKVKKKDKQISFTTETIPPTEERKPKVVLRSEKEEAERYN